MAHIDVLPVLFAVDCDPRSLDVLLSDLTRRFGNEFAVRGRSSSEAALAELHELAASDQPVALLLIDDAAEQLLPRRMNCIREQSAC